MKMAHTFYWKEQTAFWGGQAWNKNMMNGWAIKASSCPRHSNSNRQLFTWQAAVNLAKATKHHWPLGPDFLLQVQNPVSVYRKARPVQSRPMDGSPLGWEEGAPHIRFSVLLCCSCSPGVSNPCLYENRMVNTVRDCLNRSDVSQLYSVSFVTHRDACRRLKLVSLKYAVGEPS